MAVAIITGASSGLGQSYVKALKARRKDISEYWLIARRADRMLDLAQTLAPASARILALDLLEPAAFTSFAQTLAESKPDVAVLVNNAGFGLLGDVNALDPARQRDMVGLNDGALVRLCAMVLPYMKRGATIINVSSIAAFAPTPRMTTYCATKAFVLAFSRGLRVELKPQGIRVLAVCPGPMETEFLTVAKIPGNSDRFARLPRAKPDAVARASLRAASCGSAVYTPGLYKLYRVLAKCLPASLVMRFSRV